MRFAKSAVLASVVGASLAALPDCGDQSTAEYDYIVVGAGAGGGPVAAGLALNGFKVLLVDAGHHVNNINTTIPAYLARSNEDPQMALDYEVSLYPPGEEQVTNWYPRAGALGGSTVHNALIHLRPHDYDLDTLAKRFNDKSWSASSMRGYLTNVIENTQWVLSLIGRPLSYGYGGWLQLDFPPLNLILAPSNLDFQLLDMVTTILTAVTPVAFKDYNNNVNDGKEGGAAVILTKDGAGNRSSIADHLVATRLARPRNLFFALDTMATKVLLCKDASGTPKAYGIEAAEGHSLLPVARRFDGKKSLQTRQFVAKREVIISAGAFQTPQLLMLSGIGESEQLTKFGIEPVVNLPGVGSNLQDRLEMTIVWKLKQKHVLFEGCTFKDTFSEDPCLKEWAEDGHRNLYSSGPAIWAHASKSSPSLPYLDMWSMWGPGAFTGYYPGYPTRLAIDTQDSFNNVLLKAHTASKGWVKLTGSDPQDLLDINKNQFQTPEALKDLEVLKDAVKKSRALVAEKRGLNSHIIAETWPGPEVSTDDQIRAFLRKNAWGHHSCCTAKMGTDDDPMAVLNKDFQVRGVQSLRVVDISVFPEIPGFFVTTPIYQIATKAADVITQAAAAQN